MTPREDALPGGKLPPDLLAAVLAPLTPRDGRVRVGPRVGEDAAVIDLGDRLLVAAADPITFATDEIGRYVVAVNANDVAVRGATPRWLLATVLLPRGTTPDDVRALMADLAAACRALTVDLIGGHTEVTDAVTRPLVAGTMLGEVQPDCLVTTGGARPGDALVLGGALAIEGTAVLAREAAPTLRARGVPADTLDRARALLDTPGISIVAMARAVCDAVRPHALHDTTEGGLATALGCAPLCRGGGRESAPLPRVTLWHSLLAPPAPSGGAWGDASPQPPAKHSSRKPWGLTIEAACTIWASRWVRPVMASARKPAIAPSQPTEELIWAVSATLRRRGAMVMASVPPVQ